MNVTSNIPNAVSVLTCSFVSQSVLPFNSLLRQLWFKAQITEQFKIGPFLPKKMVVSLQFCLTNESKVKKPMLR